MWHTTPDPARWDVQVRESSRWRGGFEIAQRTVRGAQVPPHDIYSAEVTGLAAGETFTYRVLRDGMQVFVAEAMAPKPAGVASRIVVFGDVGMGTPEQASIAYQIHLQRPDLVAIAGDIVYGGGRMAEYQRNFFPYYNTTEAHPALGAPLLRSTLFVAAPGNHDIMRDASTERYPSGFGYFAYWTHPRNGPITAIGAPNAPSLAGTPAAVRTLTKSLGDGYPQTTNYSFDYGDTHWTVMDSNPYVDWSAPEMRAWLERDLEAAQSRQWQLVMFHHPSVHSSTINDAQKQNQMRRVSDLFERYGVDLVFAGHYHNYQRSHPVNLNATTSNVESIVATPVPKGITIDTAFDGAANTQPDGVIYIVTGAGGAPLYELEAAGKPETWLPFTVKFNGTTHSFTMLDVEQDRLTLRQLTAAGRELDRLVVTVSSSRARTQ